MLILDIDKKCYTQDGMNGEVIKESIEQESDQTASSDTIEATKQVEEVKEAVDIHGSNKK